MLPASEIPISFPLAATLQDLINVLNEADAVRCTTMASLALLLYDHMITFDIEVERIWSLKWRLPKILFLVNRYITPPMLVFNGIVLTLPNLSTGFCGFWLQWQIWPTLIALTTVELVLIVRVSALYGNNPFIFRGLLMVYLCEVGTMLGIAGFLYRGTPNPLSASSFLPGCYSISFVPWLYGFWVAPVILESIIVTLTVYKTIRLLLNHNYGSPALRLLTRDSMIYFLFMFSILFANLIIFKFAPPFFSSLLIGPSSAIACMAVARMMMNMRSLAFNPVLDTRNVGVTHELQTLPSIRFKKFGRVGVESSVTAVELA